MYHVLAPWPYFNATPVQVNRLGTAIAVDAGFEHSCAVLATGEVACWGIVVWGGGDLPQITPFAVMRAGPATAVGAGGAHDCALRADGHVACWGQDFAGQLGDGSAATSYVPMPAEATIVAGLP